MPIHFDAFAKAVLVVAGGNLLVQPLVYGLAHTGPVMAAIVVYLDFLFIVFCLAHLADGLIADRDAVTAKIDAEKQREKQVLEEWHRRAREASYAREAALDAEYEARRAAEARRQEIASLQAAINDVRRKRMGGS